MLVVPDGDHNDSFLRAGPNYTSKLRQFMATCLQENLLEEDQSRNPTEEIIEGGEPIEESKVEPTADYEKSQAAKKQD